jgi:hypothetical protein
MFKQEEEKRDSMSKNGLRKRSRSRSKSFERNRQST